jgi:hypothetical protein
MKNVRAILAMGAMLAPTALNPVAATAEDAKSYLTRQGDEAWTQSATRFLRTLTDEEDESAVLANLSDQHTIRRLDGRPASADELSSLARSSRWSKSFWYAGVPDQLASDIASTVADDPTVDASLRRFLTPASETARRNADVTALKWIGTTLAPRADQPVGVIIFHHAPISASRPATITVALISGERVGAKLYRVRNVVFGQFEVTDPR